MRCEQDRSGGWTPVALSSQAVCHGAISAWRKESLFLYYKRALWAHGGPSGEARTVVELSGSGEERRK